MSDTAFATFGSPSGPLASSVSSQRSSSSSTSISSAASVGTAHPSPSPRPNSHHRRKSSVSTRRESAEIMGITVPADTDNEEYGISTEEVRKRALLALEGRSPVLSGFTKVEIPDWQTPTVDKAFEWEMSNNVPFNFGTSSLAGKRDSFGRNMGAGPNTSKKELGTLVEEDEEEDGDESRVDDLTSKSKFEGFNRKTTTVPATHVITPSPPVKPRPASLNMSSLRRLSLAGDLPTPVSTPSPRSSVSGIRPLTLLPETSGQITPTSVTSTRRSSLGSVVSLASPGPFGTSSFQITPSPSPASGPAQKRRNSLKLSYVKTSENNGMHTPDSMVSSHETSMSSSLRTPRSSISSRASIRSVSYDRSSSPVDFANHVYSAQNHASLLDRIATLEEALAIAQAVSTGIPAASSSDELIALVADLKTERDNLANSLTKAKLEIGQHVQGVNLFQKRLESARKDAWAEKDRAEALVIEVERLKASLLKAEAQTVKAKADGERVRVMLEDEKKALRTELDEAVRARDIARAELERATSAATTMNQARRSFLTNSNMSVDSRTSTAVGSHENAGFEFGDGARRKDDLTAVIEEDDVHQSSSEDGNGVGSYEDEPTGFEDYIAKANESRDSDETDSFEDDEDFEEEQEIMTAFVIPAQPMTLSKTPTEISQVPVATASPQTRGAPETHAHAPSHSRRASLVVGWQFPKATATVSRPARVSVSLRKSPFLPGAGEEDEDEEEEGFMSSLPNSPPRKKKTPTRVEVTPDLEVGFEMNFGGDDSFVFGASNPMPFGEKQNQPSPKASEAGLATPPNKPVLKDTMRRDFAFPSRPSPSKSENAPRPSVTGRVVPFTPTRALVPPLSEDSPEYKLAKIVPLVPNPPPTALSKRLSSTGTTSLTVGTQPPSLASSTSTTATSSSYSSARSSFGVGQSHPPLTPPHRSLTSNDASGDASFSFAATPVPSASQQSNNRGAGSSSASTNVVSFPTTSPGPFSMMSSLGSFAANYMPWSPRARRADEENIFSQLQTTTTTTTTRSGGGNGQAKSHQQVVSANVQREKLRARLMQEGKIRTGSSQSSSSKRTLSP